MHYSTIFFFVVSALAMDWSTYPSVPKTATINGFADPIYDKLPDCAKHCVELSTSYTPCPYWDTGCFCVMPTWSGLVGQCFAQSCRGEDIAIATSLAYSLCNRVGANAWIMPASVSSELSSAAESFHLAAATTGSSPFTNSKTLSSVLATARTEDKTLTAPRSSGDPLLSSTNGAATTGAGFAFLLLVLSLFT